jgi:hypothetical protein
MTALATVIPLPDRPRLEVAESTAAVPEPAALYYRIVIALMLHQPYPSSDIEHCGQCAQAWPCPQVCLACRLLDGL